MESYESINDFINRVDIKDVNKLQLEGLVKSGAFDEFDEDRNKIFISIPKIIQKIKITNEDRSNNQTSLFNETNNLNSSFDYEITEKWTQKSYYQKSLNH